MATRIIYTVKLAGRMASRLSCVWKKAENNNCNEAAGNEPIKMTTDVVLPQWLDNLIFEKLGAKYCRSCSDMTVIDWDRNDVLNYLGTYFPRSYAESVCIFGEFFSQYANKWQNVEHLDVFDFGCGTGGEIIGFTTAVAKKNSKVKSIRVKALDGNLHALRLLEKVADFCSSRIGIKIIVNVIPCKIDDFYDLSVLDNILDRRFDVAMSVKSICEFVTKECFPVFRNGVTQIGLRVLPYCL